MPEQPRVDGVWIFAGLDHELVESWRAREQHPGMFAELVGAVCGLCQVLPGQFPQADLAVHGHKNVHHQRDQSLVGANIRSRLLAPDVLLARGQRQHKTTFAILVHGLTGQAAWHLPDKFFFGGEHAAVGTAESERHSERLGFHRHNVGGAGRLNDAERGCLGDGHNQQGSAFVRDLGNGLDIFDRPKEIRRLNQDARRIVAHCLFEFLPIDLSRAGERD